MTDGTVSKTQKILDAARNRAKVAEHKADEEASLREERTAEDREVVSGLRNRAEEIASVRVQARAGSLTGDIDPDAMGDVKGDGRDAKDYPDSDPDKALGVPVWEAGLGSTKLDEEVPERVFGHRHSSRTQAELNRGREALSSGDASREAATRRGSRTVVTDETDDQRDVADRLAEKEAHERLKGEDAKAETAKAEDAKKTTTRK